MNLTLNPTVMAAVWRAVAIFYRNSLRGLKRGSWWASEELRSYPPCHSVAHTAPERRSQTPGEGQTLPGACLCHLCLIILEFSQMALALCKYEAGETVCNSVLIKKAFFKMWLWMDKRSSNCDTFVPLGTLRLCPGQRYFVVWWLWPVCVPAIFLCHCCLFHLSSRQYLYYRHVF